MAVSNMHVVGVGVEESDSKDRTLDLCWKCETCFSKQKIRYWLAMVRVRRGNSSTQKEPNLRVWCECAWRLVRVKNNEHNGHMLGAKTYSTTKKPSRPPMSGVRLRSPLHGKLPRNGQMVGETGRLFGIKTGGLSSLCWLQKTCSSPKRG
jgi:hypothetical protein